MIRTITLDLTPLQGKKRQDVAGFAELLMTNWLAPSLRNHIKYAPRTSHTNALGWTELTLNQQLDGQHSPALPLVLSFDSGTEYALSAIAAAHWTELALVRLYEGRADFRNWATAFGLGLGPIGSRSLAELLGPVDTPLLEVTKQRKKHLVAARREDGALLADAAGGPQSRAELSGTDAESFADALASGICLCMFCKKLRGKPSKAKSST